MEVIHTNTTVPAGEMPLKIGITDDDKYLIFRGDAGPEKHRYSADRLIALSARYSQTKYQRPEWREIDMFVLGYFPGSLVTLAVLETA